MAEQYLPLAIYTLIALLIATVPLLISFRLGPRTQSAHKFDPYECGMDQIDSPHKPLPIKFYAVALLFMLFDIETIFFLPWAASYVDNNFGAAGWAALGSILFFTAIVTLGLIYEIRMRVLEWD
ncbi:MAG: NADH-quinone oxidoreductase subunit A [Leptospirales bacterium]|nr:NADH-quinone oxidoreductase subunit A [Leptospirales bacterium]